MNVLRELRKFKTKSALAKIRILILLAVMLTVSTYAWFSSEKDVSVGNIRGIVTEWDVEYSIDDVVMNSIQECLILRKQLQQQTKQKQEQN